MTIQEHATKVFMDLCLRTTSSRRSLGTEEEKSLVHTMPLQRRLPSIHGITSPLLIKFRVNGPIFILFPLLLMLFLGIYRSILLRCQLQHLARRGCFFRCFPTARDDVSAATFFLQVFVNGHGRQSVRRLKHLGL